MEYKIQNKKQKTPKTYVFIDASNIIYGTRNEGWKVDFKKLFKYLKENLIRKIVSLKYKK